MHHQRTAQSKALDSAEILPHVLTHYRKPIHKQSVPLHPLLPMILPQVASPSSQFPSAPTHVAPESLATPPFNVLPLVACHTIQ